jgi:hypothetical protein
VTAASVTSPVRSALRRSKDAALAFTTRTILNLRLRGIGDVTELSIDTKRRECRFFVQLAGEAEPIGIHIARYRLDERGHRTTVTILDATASREWFSALLLQFVVGRSFAVPPSAGAVLKLLA